MAKIVDVARVAGVSPATVSRTLNNDPSVDRVLADRVQRAAAELGYLPNSAARSLRRRRSDVLALIISDISNPFFTAVARGVEDAGQREGLSILLCNSDDDPAKQATYVTVAEREQVSGVIISPNCRTSDLSGLARAGIPVVAIDRKVSTSIDRVLVRSRAGAKAATLHLLDQGWARPSCITGPARTATAQDRLAGYYDALRQRGVVIDKTLVRRGDFRAPSARQAVQSLMDQAEPPDSFMIANAPMALGAIAELTARSLKPGNQVGLICFDDAPWAPYMDPPLSVIAQPAYQIGVEAAGLVLGRIGPGKEQSAREILLDTTLIARQSSLRRPVRISAETP